MASRHLGPFEILEKIGQGGMGVVWKARHTRLNRVVALKILSGDVVTDDRRRRFLYEAQAASALNHPNIITVHDIVSEPGCDAIAMEYVTGRTLDCAIPPKGLPIADVLHFAIDIASGVAAAHGAGIIHRDLKPANVMVTDAGQVKVLDFGLAKRVEPLDAGNDVTQTQAARTAEGAIVGTVSYMSPEQAEGRALDARSDIFSFGSLLYEMVAGRRAFHGDTPLSTITAILRDQPPPIAANRVDVPRELERIIARCLRKDPGRRYQTMSDVRLALEELKEDPGSEAAGGSVHEERQRRRWLWISTTAVIVATAVVGGMLWSQRAAAPHAPTLIRPLTNSAGFEGSPAVSPDGKMVAYAWNGTQSDTFDIYVKLLGSPQPLKLTSGPGAKMWPVWSPDGTRIAYTTPVGDVNRQVYEVPAFGGSPRRIADGWATDWSADGNWLLVMRQTTNEAAGGVFLIDVVSGGARRLTTFASGRLQDSARFSADGKSVFFTDVESADRSRVMRIAADGGPAHPVPITGLRQADIRTLVPGGRELLLAGLPEGGGSLALFRVPVEGGTPVPLPYGGAAALPGLAALVRAGVSAARLAPTLAFVEFRSNVNVWRVAAWPGSDRTPERWIASGREEFSAAASPDGSRIAVASTRSGVAQIWVMDADGRNGRNVTSLVGGIVGSPRWSPDGTRISFDARVEGNPDIWVVSQQGGTPRRLTTESAEDVVPDWSPDDQWVYFTSDRTGRQEVWRTPSTGGSAEQVTRGGGFNARLGRDGFIYYLKSRDTGELRRCPAAGGREETLDTRFKSRNFVVLSDGIYGLDGGEASPAGGSPATNVRPGRARFYRFRTRRWEDLGFTTARTVATNGIEVSPDRQWLYYSQGDEHGSAIMLVENFR
jgi:Tol biopolymer transport system component/tRNA A-37 threonylcarbamoyl transferase component Bud32